MHAPLAQPLRCAAPRRAPAALRRTAPARTRCAAEPASAEDMAPAGCERIRLSLKKPLGLVLEANTAGEIYVVDVVPEGSAAKDGRIEVGDQLISTSAIVYTSEDDYGGVAVKTGQKMVRLLVRGEKFDTGACTARACGWHAAWHACVRMRACAASQL